MKSPTLREFLASSTDEEFIQWLETADRLSPKHIVEKRVNVIQGTLYHRAAALLMARTQERDPRSLGYVSAMAPSSIGPQGSCRSSGFRKNLRKGDLG